MFENSTLWENFNILAKMIRRERLTKLDNKAVLQEKVIFIFADIKRTKRLKAENSNIRSLIYRTKHLFHTFLKTDLQINQKSGNWLKKLKPTFIE